MIRLYASRPVVAQSFAGQKRVTVPKQCMSLAEIVRRFVRKESLPLSQEGVYETRFGDLEKISKMDIFDQMEHASLLRDQIEQFNIREKARVEREEAERKAADQKAFEDRVAAEVVAKSKQQTAVE